MRFLFMLLGIVVLLAGLFWAAQGYGFVQWPPHAPGRFTMVGDMHWVYYGLATAVVGLLIVLFARRRRVRR
ncbi:MAG: hypothetical protein WBQ17_14905 [Rhizomicrobium sp.]